MRRRIDAAAEAAGRRPDEICGILNVSIRIDPDAEPQPDAVTGSAEQAVSQLRDLLRLGFTGFNFIGSGPDWKADMQRIAEEVPCPAIHRLTAEEVTQKCHSGRGSGNHTDGQSANHNGGYARSCSTQGQLRLVTGGLPAADPCGPLSATVHSLRTTARLPEPVAANRTPMRRTRGTHAEPLSTRRRLFNVNPLTLARDNPDDGQREPMNGPGHYREAGRLLDDATSGGLQSQSPAVPRTGQAAHGSGPRRRNCPGV